MTIIINGQLEIDQERGVIYFHSNEGHSPLRICGIKNLIDPTGYASSIDITLIGSEAHIDVIDRSFALMQHEQPIFQYQRDKMEKEDCEIPDQPLRNSAGELI
jgi:hypothetical protein